MVTDADASAGQGDEAVSDIDRDEESRVGWRVLLAGSAFAIALAVIAWLAFWPETFVELPGVVKPLLFLLPVGMYVAYWRLSRRVLTSSHRRDTAATVVDVTALTSQVTDAFPAISYDQAVLFYELIVASRGRVERITESVSPLLRSISVASSYTITQPPMTTLEQAALPLLMQQRGELIDGLKITDGSGHRISSLPQDVTVVLVATVLRKLVELASSTSSVTEYVTAVEPRVLRMIGASTAVDKKDLDELLEDFARLSFRDAAADLGTMVQQLLRWLRVYYPVVVVTDCGPQAASPLLRPRMRFSVERRLLPEYVREPGRLNALQDYCRRLMSVRRAMVAFPLTNADRCDSYHAQVKGPEGTYLARQRIANLTTRATAQLGDSLVTFQARRGQRQAHLYVRNGRQFRYRYYEAYFHERVPGSIGLAAASALGAAVIVLMCGLIRLGVGDKANSDLIAVLFAVPAVIGSSVGFDSRAIFGGTLAARVSSVATVVLSLVAALAFVLGPGVASSGQLAESAARPGTRANAPGQKVMAQTKPPLRDRDGYALWATLAAVAALNGAAALGGYVLRASTESHFVTRPKNPKVAS